MLTLEHCLPQWLSGALPGSGDFIVSQQADGKLGGINFSAPSLQIKARIVCADCNSGWMSRLEAAVRHLAATLIKGEAKALSADDQMLITRWAAKTAAVFTRAAPGRMQGVSDEHLRWLATHDEPPPGTFCWLGEYIEGTGAPKAVKVHTVPLRMERPSLPGEVFEGLAWTAGIGHLAVVVVLTPPQMWELPVSVIGVPPEWLQLIWPSAESVSRWPPTRGLADPDLQAVSRNFENHPQAGQGNSTQG